MSTPQVVLVYQVSPIDLRTVAVVGMMAIFPWNPQVHPVLGGTTTGAVTVKFLGQSHVLPAPTPDPKIVQVALYVHADNAPHVVR